MGAAQLTFLTVALFGLTSRLATETILFRGVVGFLAVYLLGCAVGWLWDASVKEVVTSERAGGAVSPGAAPPGGNPAESGTRS
ncbi:MAG: hypothetical protein HZA54_00405 [Planctomycetes bacterium]|nr:hypothetical protein [Planctomycetota bacterium]